MNPIPSERRTSERQREANRRNGRLGGPKTSEGKERSRANSLQHGLTSSTLVVLPEEDPKEYEEVLRSFRDSLQPEEGIEEALVLRLAQAHWRSLRSRRVETGILTVTTNLMRAEAKKLVENCPENLNPHEAIGVGFMTRPQEEWQMYLRYDATISRDFFKTLDQLTRLQRLRQSKTRVASQPSPDTPPKVFTSGAGAGAWPGEQLSDSGIRSVSQNGASGASHSENQPQNQEPEQAPATPASPNEQTKAAVKQPGQSVVRQPASNGASSDALRPPELYREYRKPCVA